MSAAHSPAEYIAHHIQNLTWGTRADGSMLLIVPEECRNNGRVWSYLQQLTTSGSAIVPKRESASQ